MGFEKYSQLLLNKFTLFKRLIGNTKKEISEAIKLDDFDESEVIVPDFEFDATIAYPDIDLERINYIKQYCYTYLYQALKENDINKIYYLLKNGANPNQFQKSFEENYLEYCIRNDLGLDIMDLLIKFGADINYIESEGLGLLSEAIHSGKDKVVKYLVQMGINLNQNGNKYFGDLPLLDALIYDKIGLAIYLLKNGADPNLQTENEGETPFMRVCSMGNIKLIEIFLSYGADPTIIDYKGMTVLDYIENSKSISKIDKSKILDYLKEKGAKKSTKTYGKEIGNTIKQSIENKDSKGLEKLLQNRGLPETKSHIFKYTSLALKTYDIDIFKLLIKYGANVNRKGSFGDTLLGKCFEGIRFCDKNESMKYEFYMEAIDLLISNGANKFLNSHYSPDWANAIRCGYEVFNKFYGKDDVEKLVSNQGDNPLFYACLAEDTQLINYFISRGTDINYQEYNDGMTPLMVACFRNNVALVKLLLGNGADINLRNYDGKNALFYTFMSERFGPKDGIYSPNLEVLGLLLENNIDYGMHDFPNNFRAVDYLYKHGFVDGYKFLKLKTGLQIDDLFDGIFLNDFERVKTLFNKDNSEELDIHGRTILQCAVKFGDEKIYNFLYQYYISNSLYIPNIKETYKIMIQEGAFDLLKLFLDKETNISNIIVILAYAILYGDSELVLYIIDQGIKLTGSAGWLRDTYNDFYRNTSKQTLIDGGVMLEVIEEYDNICLNINKTVKFWGYTPLMMAVGTGNLDLVRLLVEKYKVDVNGKQLKRRDGGYEKYGGKYALMIAIKDQQYEIVEYLLDNGADINVIDYEEADSVCHYINSEDHKMYELLQKYGPGGPITNREGVLPYYIRKNI